MAYAMAWRGPKATPVGLTAINGRSPRPTQAPAWNRYSGELSKRQDMSHQYGPEICGFIDGNLSSSLSCHSPYTCTGFGGFFGCCTVPAEQCNLRTSCVNGFSTNADSSLIPVCSGCDRDSRVQTCTDSLSSWCVTYTFDSGDVNYGCTVTSGGVHSVENPRFCFSSVTQPDKPTLTSETTEGSTAISTSNSRSSESSLASYLGSASSKSQLNESSFTRDLGSASSKSQSNESSLTRDLRSACSKSQSNESSLTRDLRSASSKSQSNESSLTRDLGSASTGAFSSETTSVPVHAVLSGGAIGGIAVGVAIVLVATVAAIVAACCYRRRRRRRRLQHIPISKPLTIFNPTQDTQQVLTHPAKTFKPSHLDPPSRLISQVGSLGPPSPNPPHDPAQELRYHPKNVSTAVPPPPPQSEDTPQAPGLEMAGSSTPQPPSGLVELSERGDGTTAQDPSIGSPKELGGTPVYGVSTLT